MCREQVWGQPYISRPIFYIIATQQSLPNQKKGMKTMIVNSKIKHKSKTMLGIIRNLVFDFILYFVAASIRKYLIYLTSAQGVTQNKLYIT